MIKKIKMNNEILKELKKNTKEEINSILEHIAYKQILINYKKSVPFVHIPIELEEQWKSRFMIEKKWFREIYDLEDVLILKEFDVYFNEVMNSFGNNIPDIPEILESTVWKNLSKKAMITLNKLNKIDCEN